MCEDSFCEQATQHHCTRGVVETLHLTQSHGRFGGEQGDEELQSLTGHVEHSIAQPEHRAAADRRQPHERSGGERQRFGAELWNATGAQARRRLPPPDLARHPMAHDLGRQVVLHARQLRSRARCAHTRLEHSGRQRGAETSGGDFGVDRLAYNAMPSDRNQPDREMLGGLVDGLCSMRVPARQVQAVAGGQREVEQRLAQLLEPWLGDGVPALDRIDGARERLPDPPALATSQLDDEHIVVVEVQVEPAGPLRREVGVDLHGMVECDHVAELLVAYSGAAGHRVGGNGYPRAHDAEGGLARPPPEKVLPERVYLGEARWPSDSRTERTAEEELLDERLGVTDELGQLWRVRMWDSLDLPVDLRTQESAPSESASVPSVSALSVASVSALSVPSESESDVSVPSPSVTSVLSASERSAPSPVPSAPSASLPTLPGRPSSAGCSLMSLSEIPMPALCPLSRTVKPDRVTNRARMRVLGGVVSTKGVTAPARACCAILR